jgi:hypothetical protein
MAYHEVAMWEILTVLRLIGAGHSKSIVASTTGHSRSTVRRYVALAVELGWKLGHEEPTEQLATEISRRLNPAADRDAGDTEQLLLPLRDQIRKWLKPAQDEKRGLRLSKVHQLLVRQGVKVPYSSLHRFAIKHCGFGDDRSMTYRMAESAPGEVAEVDFGRLGLVFDPHTGRRRLLWALVVVLIFSRHQYVHTTYTQKLKDILDGLEDAWFFFGGVVRRLILDNPRTAISKADRYDPVAQRTFEEYAQFRGLVIDPAPVREPTGKPHVERGVLYVRENFFRGEDWRDRDDVQQRVITWCLQMAGTRTHGTTRKCPLAVFENEERAHLLPLTRERFDPPQWIHCKVHPDHHISVGKALYSAPSRYLRKMLWVRIDSKLVRLYFEGELIKTHSKQPPGGRSTDHNDYPQEVTSYTLRDPQRIIRQAAEHSKHIGIYAERLLSGDFPWAKLRQAQKLLRLGDKYGWRRLEAACERALAFELLNVRRLEDILRNNLTAPQHELPLGEARVIPIRTRFQRSAHSFSHHSRKEEGHD